MKAPSTPVFADATPFFARLKFSILLALFRFGLTIAKRFRLLESKDPKGRPSYVKSYPPLPGHQARIFIPQTHKPGDVHPLVIDIHGGGFCLGAPVVNDKDNAILSQEHGFCVVSIPYRMGPEVKHPIAVYDVASMINAVLADGDLPVDTTRIVLAGYSAGGNLALAVNQLPSVRGKISAVVAYYPSTNNTHTMAERIKRSTPHMKGRNNLKGMMGMFSYGYVAPGTNRADPLYSPIFAHRRDLPAKIFIIGCEYDMLCPEAQDMAEDLASHESADKVQLIGRNGWSKGNIRWELIEGAEHGFNQIPKRGKELLIAQKQAIAMHAGAAQWLKTVL